MGMVIIIDDREKYPYNFSLLPGGNIKTDRVRLLVGDYTIAGLEGDIAAERKSVRDFFRCLDEDYERFSRQIIKGKTQVVNYRVYVEEIKAKIEQELKKNKLMQDRYYYLSNFCGVDFRFYDGVTETAKGVLRWFKDVFAAGEKAALDGLMPSEKLDIFCKPNKANTMPIYTARNTAAPPIPPFQPPPIPPFQPPSDEEP